MTKTLRISPDLGLPIEAATQTFAFLGKRGSGKTMLASSSGYSGADNGAYKNERSRLRTLGLIEYVSGGARAADILFPEGR